MSEPSFTEAASRVEAAVEQVRTQEKNVSYASEALARARVELAQAKEQLFTAFPELGAAPTPVVTDDPDVVPGPPLPGGPVMFREHDESQVR